MYARITATSSSTQIRLPHGWRVVSFDVLDSTNTALRRMVEAGTEATEGLVVMAKAQTAGRGRGGRAWTSPVGNLYASFLIESRAGLARAAEIGFVAAAAVMSTIQALVPDRASQAALRCKWPNDVLFDGAKVSGILCETASAPDSPQTFVILGIGLNLVPVTLPHAPYPITSLSEQGGRVSVPLAIEALAKHVAHFLDVWRVDGFAPIRKIWLDHAAGFNETHTIQMSSNSITGRLVDLDMDGALVVIDEAGHRQRILAGDVTFTKQASDAARN